MTDSEWVGAVGVALLLAAFVLNLLKVVNSDNRWYCVMNVAGAGLACLSSVMIRFFPFIILEGAWALISLVSLIKSFRNPQ
jgi:hypothetical protein